MIDIREDLRRAAGNAPPAPDLWDGLEARVARVRRTRRRATVAAGVAAVAAAVAVAAPFAINGNPLSPPTTATLPAAFGSSPTDVTIDRLTVSVPDGCVVGPPEYVSPVRYGNAGLVTDGSTAVTDPVSARMSGRMLMCGASRIHIVVLRPLTPDQGGDLSTRMYATAADARGATSIEVPGVGAGFIERTDSANASTTILFGDMSGGFIASVGGGSSELLDAVLAGARLE